MAEMEKGKMAGIPKVLLFYNPTSGSGMFKKNLDHIVERFAQKGMLVVPVRALSGISVDDVISSISDDDYVKIIAAGGDGTINIIVNAMVRSGRHVPLAVFPAGTANDYAHYFHIPSDLDGMIDVALQDHYLPADIGRYNDKYFINVLSLGAVIDVSHKTKSSMKNSLGMFAYYLKAASELPSLHAVPVTVDAVDEHGDQIHLEEKVLFLLVLNGNSAGGFRRMSEDSSVSDGLFDVIIFKGTKLSKMPGTGVSVLKGTHRENENVIFFRTRHIKIDSSESVETDIDGEAGDRLPLDVEIVPRRLMINALPMEDPMEEK